MKYFISIFTMIIFVFALIHSGLNIQEKISFVFFVLSTGMIGSMSNEIATIFMLDLICKDEKGNYKKTSECEALKKSGGFN